MTMYFAPEGKPVHEGFGFPLYFSGDILAVNGVKSVSQVGAFQLVPINSDVTADSQAVHTSNGVNEDLFPGSTIYKNPPGDTSVVFYVTPVALFCAMFNISLDPMYEIELIFENSALKIEN